MRQNWLVLLALFLLVLPAPTRADRQENVDAIVRRIRETLEAARNSPDWLKSYKLVQQNIRDLENTLRYGGKVRGNPVREHWLQLKERQAQLKAEWKILCDTQEALEKARRKQSRQTLNDIVGEMIQKFDLALNPSSALGTWDAASTENLEVIKRDFQSLHSLEQAIKLIEVYKKNLRPAIHDCNERLYALQPLTKQYQDVARGLPTAAEVATAPTPGPPANIDGEWSCSINGLAGTLKFSGGSASLYLDRGRWETLTDFSFGGDTVRFVRPLRDLGPYEQVYTGKLTSPKALVGTFDCASGRGQPWSASRK